MSSPSAPTPSRPHLVVIGGGFGGLRVAMQLSRTPIDITVVDRRNHHLFQPLLYQVATAGMMAESIAVPIRSVLSKQKNARVLLAEATDVDLDAREVRLADGTSLFYDYLVVAAGARTSYFGHDEWAEHTVGLKSVEDAYAIRRRVLMAFEAAERERDAAKRRRLLTFVVIGGGPTGVEMAGALAELTRSVLARDFRVVQADDIRVMLLEAAPRLLLAFDESLGENARHELLRLGVEVHTGRGVTKVERGAVHLGSEVVRSDLIVWAAGVQPIPLAKQLKGLPATQRGYVPVEQDCSVAGHPHAFAIGDIAAFIPEPEKKKAAQGAPADKPRPLPGVAPVAMQQGNFVARTIARELAGKPREKFVYFDKGSMATIGRSRAVLQYGRLKLHGFFAWTAWLAVHIFYLIGFRNRFVVMLDWAWTYFTNHRGARLISGRLGKGRDGANHGEDSVVTEVDDKADIAQKSGWAQNVRAPKEAS